MTFVDLGSASGSGRAFRTPGAPEDTDAGPDFVMSSGEDWTAIGHVAHDGSGGFDVLTSWRILCRNSAFRGGVTTVGGPGVPARFDLTHSPVALYHGAGDANDYSGNGFHLNAGTPEYIQVLPNVKGFYSTQSANAARRSAHDATLAITGDITIQAIVKVIANASSGAFVAGFFGTGTDSDSTQNTLYFFGWDGSDELRWNSESNTPSAGTDANFVSTGTSGEVTPAHGDIYYMAAVRSSNVITFYLNGLQWGSSSGTLQAPVGGSAGVLRICSGVAGAFMTLGVKIVASALSAAQIKAEYNRTMGVAFGTLA